MRLPLAAATALAALIAVSSQSPAAETPQRIAGFATQRQHQAPLIVAPEEESETLPQDQTPSTLQKPRGGASGLPTGKRTHKPVLQGAAEPPGPGSPPSGMTGTLRNQPSSAPGGKSPGGLGSKGLSIGPKQDDPVRPSGGLGRKGLSIGPKQDDPAPPPSHSHAFGDGVDDGPSNNPAGGVPGSPGGKGLSIGPKQDDPAPPPSASLDGDDAGADDGAPGGRSPGGQSPGGLGSKRGALSIGPKQDDPAPPAPASSSFGNDGNDDGDGKGPGPAAVDGITPNPVDRPAGR